MAQPIDISQAEYEQAAAALLRELDLPLDLESFHTVWLLHQAADTAREHQSREALDHFALSWSQFEVLWNVWIFGEREAGWVSRAALISKSGLTSILTQLERRDLIHRRADAHDGRKSLVGLSDHGQQLMLEVLAKLNEADRSFTQPLTQAQKERLIHLLTKLLSEPPPGRSAPTR